MAGVSVAAVWRLTQHDCLPHGLGTTHGTELPGVDAADLPRGTGIGGVGLAWPFQAVRGDVTGLEFRQFIVTENSALYG